MHILIFLQEKIRAGIIDAKIKKIVFYPKLQIDFLNFIL